MGRYITTWLTIVKSFLIDNWVSFSLPNLSQADNILLHGFDPVSNSRTIMQS
jgi:hypothetical protein